MFWYSFVFKSLFILYQIIYYSIVTSKSFVTSIFLFVLCVVHSFLFFVFLLLQRLPLMFLFTCPHHVLVLIRIILLLKILWRFFFKISVLYSKFLQIFCLPSFSLLFFTLYNIWIKRLSILSYRKFFIVIHWDF